MVVDAEDHALPFQCRTPVVSPTAQASAGPLAHTL